MASVFADVHRALLGMRELAAVARAHALHLGSMRLFEICTARSDLGIALRLAEGSHVIVYNALRIVFHSLEYIIKPFGLRDGNENRTVSMV